MTIRLIGISFLAVALGVLVMAAVPAGAQQTTEQFIPIGQSPGVSGKYSYLGEIVSIDRDTNTITVRDASGVRSMRMTERTKVWIDRSERKRHNTTAGLEDCEVGDTVEVKYVHGDESTVDWIKIERS